ncbi:MAG: hypothetical protein JXA94_01625 [Parachlamydiales bacterium]|nr:hypothetical protein [Parachlamydiales bacterium]
MIEKISGPGGSKPSERKDKKSSPDSKEFEDLMKTEKVREIELEKRRKRKFKSQDEENGKTTSAPGKSQGALLPSPYESYQQTRQPSSSGTQKSSYEVDENQPDDRTQRQQPRTEKQKEEEKRRKKTEEEMVLQEPKKDQTTGKVILTEEEKQKIAKAKKAKITTFKTKHEEKDFKEEKKPTTERASQLPLVLQEMDKSVAIQTHEITATTTPYLHSDVAPLFQKMIGTIIQMQTQSVTTTEVTLNSPAFETSIFYGSTIVLQRYATAPDSFNIILKGSNQAVSLFNENLEGLFDAFKKGNFNFKIGRLEAEYERPLFKRKEKTGDKGTDSEPNG